MADTTNDQATLDAAKAAAEKAEADAKKEVAKATKKAEAEFVKGENGTLTRVFA